ncbi:hybrid sensor histidine kinase/response regulator transcription factor [Chryseolinea lacunae]|uniref:histidine kinase n=1 Tax=Chryseolinea lacunae TaxID=2801331 RepID=A0ABS1L1M8_9BACT|nr:two-component regulator propeller domain-containing protein [Chryseolinea lacunae]MBL0745475.1 response regulator [Chryseolinea lacunae]
MICTKDSFAGRVWLVMMLAFLCVNASAQKLQFDNYSLPQGLSQSTVVSMFQDRHGFLWIGTEDGLNRFDGYAFKIFRKDAADTAHTIAGNFVWDIVEAPDGKLWIGHEGGISCYDPALNTFQPFRIGDGSATVRTIVLEANNKGLWLGTSGQGLFHFDIATHALTSYINDIPQNLPFNTILHLAPGGGNELLVGTRGGGLFLFSPDKKFYRPALAKKDSLLLMTNDIWRIVQHKGRYWLGTLKGLVALDANLAVNNYFPMPRGERQMQRVSSLLFDTDESIWVASYGGGLVHLHPETGVYTFSNHTAINASSLANDLVFSLLQDRSKNLWIGTWVGGVSMLRKGHDNFINYSNDDLGTPSNFITSIVALPCGDSETLFVGAYGAGMQTASLREPANNLHFAKYDPFPEALSKSVDLINCFYKGETRLWIGTDNNGFVGIPLDAAGCLQKTKDIVHYAALGDGNSLSHGTVKAVVEDKDGNLWAVTVGGGANKIVGNKTFGALGSVVQYVNDPKNPASLSHNRVNTIFKDKQQNLWLATSNGLNLYDGNNGFQHFLSGKIITLFQSAKGKLYAGSEHGLFVNESANGAPAFREVKALAGQLINAVQQDGVGRLWVATNQGLFRYDPATEDLIQFRSSDGLQSDEYNFNASAQTARGMLVFGGVNGLTLFDPQHIVLNPTPPSIIVTSLKLDNKEVPVAPEKKDTLTLARSVWEATALSFRHNQNYLTFEFAALDFTNPSKNRYAYTLEGFDKNWITTTAANRSATYTNLDPGTYTLKVKAANNDGVWNETGTTLTITIHPPWWKTWYAYVVYALAALVVLALARRGIIQRERLKTQLQLGQIEVQKLKELDDFKSKFFANISHEFRTPLSLILGPTERLMQDADGQRKGDLVTIRNNGKSLLNLVNQMLDLSRIEAGNLPLQVSNVDVAYYLKIFAEAFHSMAQQKELALSVDVPSEPVRGYADISFLEKMVNNLLSNAIKYTAHGGKISVMAAQHGDHLMLSVTDTGKGIAPDQLTKIFERFYRVHETASVEGTGLGLALTRELVKTHKGEIAVKSVPGEGSTFTLTLPIDKKYYSASEIIAAPAEVETNGKAHNDVGHTAVQAVAENSQALLLIVEDNPELRAFIRSAFADRYRILEAAEGESGVALATAEIPDLIISDWMMPGMDGLAFCRVIKTTEVTSHIPVILLTAKAGTESRVQGLETGADDYLTKPFDLQELKVRATNLIEQRQLLRRKFAQQSVSLYQPVKATSTDEKFLNRLRQTVEEHLKHSGFGVEDLAREMGLSRVQLYRKITALTNQSASEFLRNYRLERAADLLRQGAGNVSEIAYQVGFENPSYFTKTFREHFGKLPSDITKS